MKESLAARQAALLRQNAELDQKVEAIEQRRQQQLQSAKSTSGSSSNLTKRHEISLAEPSSAVFSDDDDGGLEDGVSDSMSSPERGVSLKMDFTGSIDSTPDDSEKINGTEDTKPFTATRQKSQLRKDKSAENVAAGLASESTRKPARRHKAGSPAMGQEETKQSESSRDVKQTMDEDDGLGLDATVRYQKARLRVLQDELDVAHSDLKEMQGTQQQLRTTNEELASDNTTLKKKHMQTQQLLEKQQELSAAQESKQKILESQLSAAQAKMDELQKAEKKASQQFRSKDVRLNRALEELEKAKAQLQDERQAQGDQLVSKAEHDHVLKDNKRLEKQKNELLVAFKKQMKLIDLLKRQRIHMEAAKMLSFTEEEFSKTLELG